MAKEPKAKTTEEARRQFERDQNEGMNTREARALATENTDPHSAQTVVTIRAEQGGNT